MWVGSGKHTVKDRMIEIDQKRLGIIPSLKMGYVAWKWKTHSQKGVIDIDQESLGIIQSLEMGIVAWKLKAHSQIRNDRD